MIALLKNNGFRLIQKRQRLLLMLGIMVISIIIAIYMSGRENAPLHIGVIGDEHHELVSNQRITVSHLTEDPSMLQLLKGEYDAVITKEKNQLTVASIKNEPFENEIRQSLLNPNNTALKQQTTSTGSRIIGFLLMFLLMSAIVNMYIFNEDKEKHLMERIVATPTFFWKLLLSYSLLTFGLLLFPTLAILAIAKTIFSVTIGFSFIQYLFLLCLISLVGTAYSLFIAAFISTSDQANMIGSMTVMLTTILSGSFFSFEGGNRWIDGLIKWLPQKNYLNIVELIESGGPLKNVYFELFYLLGLTLLFFSLAVLKTKKEYVRK
jgi:ABC-2 type transport system permease protein